ncbi:MAG: zinc ribbon domain-containing protein [Lachnospiraceae bacterium]|nr:zinc ribbon domain-containing protein [Lachnospiraceae bacterium]
MLKEKLKEFRFYAVVVFVIGFFVPWGSFDSSASAGEYSSSVSQDLTGDYVLTNSSILGLLIILMVIAIAAAVFIPKDVIPTKIIYLIASLLGIVLTIIVFFRLSSLANAGGEAAGELMSEYGVDTEVGVKPGIGFIMYIAGFLFVLIYTIIKDFAINKQVLKEEGVKGAFNKVAGQVQEGTASFSSDKVKNAMQSGAESLSNAVGTVSNTAKSATGKVKGNESQDTKACPSCGNILSANKKFCGKCGYKFEVESVPKNIRSSKNNKQIKENMTVKEYIKTLDRIECSECGEFVTPGQKFCPNCGKDIIIKISPEKCVKCGSTLIPGKKFCADCGEPIVKKALISECPYCNADLIFGKKFCAECGKEVDVSA